MIADIDIEPAQRNHRDLRPDGPTPDDEGFLGIDDREFSIPKYSSVCTHCAHVAGFRSCKAFGDQKFSLEIWNGENDHTKPYPGDRGVLFTAV